MRLQDVMSTKVKTVAAGASADSAWDRMQANGIHHFVVVRDGKVAGVLSERDLGGKRGAALRRGQNVEDLMSAQVVSAKPTTTLKQAANILRGYGIGCLPVMDDKKLKGIVTVSDLLELVGRGVTRPETRSKKAVRKREAGGRSVRRG